MAARTHARQVPPLSSRAALILEILDGVASVAVLACSGAATTNFAEADAGGVTLADLTMVLGFAGEALAGITRSALDKRPTITKSLVRQCLSIWTSALGSVRVVLRIKPPSAMYGDSPYEELGKHLEPPH